MSKNKESDAEMAKGDEESISLNSLGNLHGRVDFFGIETLKANKPIYQKLKVVQTWIFLQAFIITLITAYLIFLSVWIAPFFPVLMNSTVSSELQDAAMTINDLRARVSQLEAEVASNIERITFIEDRTGVIVTVEEEVVLADVPMMDDPQARGGVGADLGPNQRQRIESLEAFQKSNEEYMQGRLCNLTKSVGDLIDQSAAEKKDRQMQYTHLCDRVDSVQKTGMELNETLREHISDYSQFKAGTVATEIDLRNQTCYLNNTISGLRNDNDILGIRMSNSEDRLIDVHWNLTGKMKESENEFITDLAELRNSHTEVIDQTNYLKEAYAQLVEDLGGREYIRTIVNRLAQVLPQTPQPNRVSTNGPGFTTTTTTLSDTTAVLADDPFAGMGDIEYSDVEQ